MAILHFTRYNALGLQQYQTADEETAKAVASLIKDNNPASGYIINRRDINALVAAGNPVIIK